MKIHNRKHIGCRERYCFREFKKFTDAGICLMGNINPYVFDFKMKHKTSDEVKNCMYNARDKGFILSTGCEIPLNALRKK